MKKVLPENAILIPDNATQVFKGQIFDVYQWPQKMFDGSEATFEMLKRPDTVSVIGVVDNKIIVVDDDQPHNGSRLSFPGGRVDSEDTSPSNAARREMLEETGYDFKEWRLIQVIQPHTKLEWFIYYFLAVGGNKVAEPHLDAGERIKVDTVPFEKIKSLVLNKAGYLGESKELLEFVNNLDELLNLPEFKGQEVDR